MGNLVVINALDITKYALTPIGDKKSSFHAVLEYAGSLPDVTDTVCFMKNRGDAAEVAERFGVRCVVRETWTVSTLLREISGLAEGPDTIFYIYGDTPLLDLSLSEKMLRDHTRYFSQYTFAEGYPCGLTPEILGTDLLPALLHLEGDEERSVERNSIFTVLQKDINSFEIETVLSPKDMRLLRVSLTADSKRNTLQLASVVEAGGRDAESINAVLEERPELLRTLPAYIDIQITGGCPQSCAYCPYPKMNPDLLESRERMDIVPFGRLIDEVSAYCDDAVIGLGLFGEPAFHPRIGDFIRRVLEKPSLGLVIETSGIGWDKEVLRELSKEGKRQEKQYDRYTWIVSLDSPDQEVYNALRGDGYYEALETARLLMKLFPGRVWVQAVRMNENEETLEGFYRDWKNETENVIIQKYDSFCGFLKDRKVADLSPVIRFPCWHVKRDISVLLDGTVPLCREDVRGAYCLGNIFAEGIEAVWERGKKYYEEHVREAYNDLCKVCDEYYTYNF